MSWRIKIIEKKAGSQGSLKRRQEVRGLSWRIKIIEKKTGSQGLS